MWHIAELILREGAVPPADVLQVLLEGFDQEPETRVYTQLAHIADFPALSENGSVLRCWKAQESTASLVTAPLLTI
jgi:hypothetical protein